ncbi:DMT family transporter [Streptomyces xinghaiensis]|uniref:DMT family transporter n=1 Tax=Streptomyces xinghaiensis TaxID=1038928 RepID=UPI003990B425
MRDNDSATEAPRIALRGGRPAGTPSGPAPGPAPGHSPARTAPRTSGRPVRDSPAVGTALAVLGVAAFSLTFPGTVWALEGFGPWTVTAARGVLAGLIAGGCLAALRVPAPERRHWPGLLTVAAGVVLGFPLLTTLALRTSTASHAAVVVGLLPLTTAVFAAVRTRTRHSGAFWAAAVAGAAAVCLFALTTGGGALSTGDAYLAAALLVCAAGYTEGGRLARVMPGWQVTAWALVACLPLTVPWLAVASAREPAVLTGHAVAGLLWLGVGSQFLGLVVWYRGMGVIGVARAGQFQLAQPLLTLVWAVLLLGEELDPAAPLTAAAVLVCIAVTQRADGPPAALSATPSARKPRATNRRGAADGSG